jgi:hypothetical protein
VIQDGKQVSVIAAGEVGLEREIEVANAGESVGPADPLKSPRTGASSPRPLYLTECLLIGPKENAA